ncbi:hypothetical protein LCGC14_0491100 [marine sediment metagenome]|uniref:Uncharacterized protein n=1 Tax=marine sediment metagenome TaxID=412755 RepID=A0A0F9SPX7_9ZZZZ
MDTIVGFLQSLPNVLGPVISTGMGLIVLDLGLGVAIALRKGVFQWEKTIIFYRTNVFPFGIAAIVIAAAAQFISADVLPAYLADPIADLGTLIGVGPMFAYLVLGSIIPNVRALVLGKYKWEIQFPAIAALDDADKEAVPQPSEGWVEANEKAAVAPAYEGPLPGAVVAASLPDDAVDIAALNEDGTAVDRYDPETLNHVGSESVPPKAGADL